MVGLRLVVVCQRFEREGMGVSGDPGGMVGLMVCQEERGRGGSGTRRGALGEVIQRGCRVLVRRLRCLDLVLMVFEVGCWVRGNDCCLVCPSSVLG